MKNPLVRIKFSFADTLNILLLTVALHAKRHPPDYIRMRCVHNAGASRCRRQSERITKNRPQRNATTTTTTVMVSFSGTLILIRDKVFYEIAGQFALTLATHS